MSDQQQKDQSSDILWLLFGIVAIVAIVLFFFGRQLAFYYLTLKLYELKLITLIWPSQYHKNLVNLIETTPIRVWQLSQVMAVGHVVGMIINIPIVAALGYFAYKVYKKNPLQKFRRVLTMQTLKESEQKIWPYIAPMVDVNLMKEPFDEGPFAMAHRPYDYAVEKKLLEDVKNVNSMDKIRAEKCLISQLGKLWGGFDKMQKHEQALFAIFAAHGCGDKKGAMDAINQIAQSVAVTAKSISDPKKKHKKMPDFSSVKPLLKYCDDPRVKAIVAQHAYVYTILPSMLEFARSTGVCPPSYFIWLRPRDRVLWLMLNCVGRQVAFVEVAGIFGHWKAEQIAKHKLEAPYVAKAVDGLERALGEVKIT
jgi:intracellular multiplication protein IcmP